MARHLFWTERVALSALIVFLFSIEPVLSQTADPANTAKPSITYTCRATRLESVIEFLSRTTGYHFIYSRNMVDITRPVSLNVVNRSIDDVLVIIAKQVDVNFKVQDRHIIIKSIPKTEAPVKPGVVAQPVARTITRTPLSVAGSPRLTSVVRTIPSTPASSNRIILESKLDRRIRELQARLGPNVPRDIPAMYINRINFNDRNHGWFASVGMAMNDLSNGFEIQGGVRYLYGVVQPRWSIDRGFYGFYGVGNSFTLQGNFSFNTIYMYSGNKQTETIFPFSPIAKLGPEFQLTQTMRQHQVKFAVQYAFSPKVTARLGPVLNYRTTVTELMPAATPAAGYYYESTIIFRQPGTGIPDIIYENGRFLPQTIRNLETWIGWEGAVSYRLNFSHRR